QPEASSPGAKDENTGAGLCRSRLVVQERLGHYIIALTPLTLFIGMFSLNLRKKMLCFSCKVHDANNRGRWVKQRAPCRRSGTTLAP
ncbi:hypothetical protein ACSZOL_21955, partial [Aeromonas hydrophila]|uniref:hypothetical protein n=1 Tax=Aeromonas hydrophila TaxID=644 RepID=UPI003EC64356